MKSRAVAFITFAIVLVFVFIIPLSAVRSNSTKKNFAKKNRKLTEET